LSDRRVHFDRTPPGIRADAIETFDRDGLEQGVVLLIKAGRQLLESAPVEFGELLMDGVLYDATIQAAGRRAEFERKRLGWNYHNPPTEPVAMIPATIFTTIAYEHPYHDGNKRTAFLTSMLTARALGFMWWEPLDPWEDLLEDVRAFVEGNESEDPRRKAGSAPENMAKWMLGKIFTVPPQQRE